MPCTHFADEEAGARGASGLPGSLLHPGWDGVTGLLCPGRCERPRVWTSACVWAYTQGTCCVGSLGCASGSTTCGPTMCPWPTGWRRLESLGEAQRARGGVRGRGPAAGWAGSGGVGQSGVRDGSDDLALGEPGWALACSALRAVRPRGGCRPSLGPAALTRGWSPAAGCTSRRRR